MKKKTWIIILVVVVVLIIAPLIFMKIQMNDLAHKHGTTTIVKQQH